MFLSKMKIEHVRQYFYPPVIQKKIPKNEQNSRLII